jgi:hypothetical protein
LAILKVIESYNEKSDIFFYATKAIHKNKDNWSKIGWKKCLSSYFIRLYERQNCPESDLYGSTQVESLICRARSQICTQYRLGVRFVCACHLALVQGLGFIVLLYFNSWKFGKWKCNAVFDWLWQWSLSKDRT